MHCPYRLMLLIFAAAVALSHEPIDTTRKSEMPRKVETVSENRGVVPSARCFDILWRKMWWGCAALVPPYHFVPLYQHLQPDVERFTNEFIGMAKKSLKTLAASNDGNLSGCPSITSEFVGQPLSDLWMFNYAKAMTAAEDRNQMLLVFFCKPYENSPCNRFKAETLDDPLVRTKLRDYVCVQVPLDAKITVDGKEVILLEHPSFREMLGRPGIAIVDFRSSDSELRGAVVSMFPITEKLWYTPEQMAVILDLPPGTLTQRTLIYAVRIHPEKPASANGQLNSDLLREAESHARYQAEIRVQGHQQWGTRFQRIIARLPGGISPREVCAESWPGENLVEAAIECVRCWRLSSGHWNAVRSPNRFFGYDMKRGSNGVWYATGIFGGK